MQKGEAPRRATGEPNGVNLPTRESVPEFLNLHLSDHQERVLRYIAVNPGLVRTSIYRGLGHRRKKGLSRTEISDALRVLLAAGLLVRREWMYYPTSKAFEVVA